jgi:glutathione synthase/RimK-type ligase-like ATP-grasp enzyme
VAEKIVLLITHSKDYFTIDRVKGAVSQKGYRPYRFNTDNFPQDLKLAIQPDRSGTVMSLEDGDKNTVINIKDIYSVWFRKIGSPHIDKEMDPLLRDGCIKESTEVLNIFLDQLNAPNIVRCIDHPAIVRKVENKLYQLKAAQSVDIRAPKTLITNNPRQLNDFYREMGGNIIAKMLTPLTVSMEGNTPFVYTSRVGPEDLESADMLRFSPMAFQEYIEKEYELRIIYVDGQLFTGAVHSKSFSEEPVDWRAADHKEFKWENFKVPTGFADKIRTFMKNVGLYFGALDVIVQPDGQYVFLEVNPTGEWGMLERDLNLPISQAIADALTPPRGAGSRLAYR